MMSRPYIPESLREKFRAALKQSDQQQQEYLEQQKKLMTKQKVIVVTGGCGYIGSHVARAFKTLDPSSKVVVIDNVRRGHTLKNIDWYIMADFAADTTIKSLRELEPDVIVHCAGTSLVGPSIMDPATYYDNNVSKTIKLLSAVKDFEKQPLIMFSSSASVYGEANVPAYENDSIRPISPYGKTKAMIEDVFRDYAVAYGLTSVCFRYFNAAGAMPGSNDLGQELGATHIVARILEAKLADATFTLNGKNYDTPDGTCIRDYIHVWDIALAHIAAYAKYEDGVIRGAQVYNLGTNQGTSNQDILNYVAGKYGDIKVQIGPKREGDPNELIANSDEAQRVLKWTPRYSTIAQIVDTAYAWYTRK